MNNKFKCSALIALLISSGSVGLTSDVPVKLNNSIENYKAVSSARPDVRKISVSSVSNRDIKPISGANPNQISTLALNDTETIDPDHPFTNSETVTKDSITNNGGTGVNQAEGNLTVTGALDNNSGSFTNEGTLSTDSLSNSGTFKNSSSLTVTNELNNKSGSFTNSGSGNLETDSFTNGGTLTNEAEFTSNGTTSNTGTLTNTNSFKTKDFSNTGSGALNNNSGTFTADGTVTNESSITNSGTLNFNGEVEGSSGSITNSGNLTLKGNASDYQGSFSQSSGTTTVEDGAIFFGGTSSVTNGTLKWNAKSGDAKNLQMSGGTLDVNGNLTLTSTSSIADEVKAQVEKESSLTLEGGTLNLDKTDSWQGNITLAGGTLGLNEGVVQNGKLTANTGNLNINSDYTFDGNTTIAEAVKVNLIEGKTLTLTDGNSLTMTKDDDTWAGEIDVKGGNLTVSGSYQDESGLLKADTGSVSFEGADFYLDNKSYIEKEVAVSIDGGSTLSLKDGELHINDNDTWEGTVNLNDENGTLHYWLNDETSKNLEATKGSLQLENGSKFNFKGDIATDVNVNIKDGSTLHIQEGEFIMDSKDQWNGLIVLDEEESKLTAEGVNNTQGGAGLHQTKGTSSFTDSNIVINDENSYIKGGDVTLDNSSLTFGKNLASGSEADFTMANDSVYGIMNGGIDTANANSVDIEKQGNFTVDISPRDRKGDYFDFSALNTSEGGIINVSDFDFLGLCPVDRYIDLQLFNNEKINEDIIFKATDKLIRTPVGYFGIRPIEGEAGMYQAYLNKYVPEEFRGQVATLAMFTNQLRVGDIVTNHFILHDSTLIDNAKYANKYSAVSPLFAPYQRTYEDGGIWSKSYASFERLNMTQGLSVGNNTYGTLAGVDLPAVDLNEDWKFIPSGYVGYTGANQYYDGVRSYQNGGQLGVMGTFIKNQDFITTVTAYGGGYLNEMTYEGFRDETGNWFAGSAVKTAYNLHPFKDFVVQPNLFMSYNAFGKQNWGSEYGVISMKSGMINAANIAPGLNLILSKETWSIYGTLQYMFFINDKVDGYAGNIHLPNVRMEHGVVQYGIGATKTFKDNFASYAQLNLFNAGITGIGFQLGLQYLFDLKLPWNKTKSADEKTHKKLIGKA